ncbi:hypothetical protein [Bacillus sp. T3]|nr:hypothetical protein [Bacillus sp. T3]
MHIDSFLIRMKEIAAMVPMDIADAEGYEHHRFRLDKIMTIH